MGYMRLLRAIRPFWCFLLTSMPSPTVLNWLLINRFLFGARGERLIQSNSLFIYYILLSYHNCSIVVIKYKKEQAIALAAKTKQVIKATPSGNRN